jgi:hypothetical protein
MMQRLLAISLGLVGPALIAVPTQAACLKANADHQVAEGRLTSVTFSVPDYNLKEQAYILKLSAPACLDGEDFDKVENTDRIHVFSMDAAVRKRLRGFVGKLVRVDGSAFGEQTMHHHAPIVMIVTAIEALRKK